MSTPLAESTTAVAPMGSNIDNMYSVMAFPNPAPADYEDGSHESEEDEEQ